MKKTYVKPMIAVEQYMLSQSIAACTIQIGSANSQCVLNDPRATPEMKDYAKIGFFISGCSDSASGMMDDDGFCYHTNVNATFSS